MFAPGPFSDVNVGVEYQAPDLVREHGSEIASQGGAPADTPIVQLVFAKCFPDAVHVLGMISGIDVLENSRRSQ